jgi:hypothetical protein
MLPTEEIDQILIVVVDETYPPADEDAWEAESAAYRRGLEQEFGVRFEEANVGPGADIPAFLTILASASVPLWSVVAAAFFLGKPINDNLTAWQEIGRRIRGFFSRPVILGRHGASVLAVEAVFDEMGGTPKTIRLLSYRPAHIGETQDLAQLSAGTEILENPPTLNLGYVRHVFEIEADGRKFRVGVDGKTVQIIPLNE